MSKCEAGGSDSEELKGYSLPFPALLWIVNAREKIDRGKKLIQYPPNTTSPPLWSFFKWIMTSRWVLWVKLRLVCQYFWINWKEKWTYRGPASDILHDKSALSLPSDSLYFLRWISSSTRVFKKVYNFDERRRFVVKPTNYRHTFKKCFFG